jgi:hypothetical protein
MTREKTELSGRIVTTEDTEREKKGGGWRVELKSRRLVDYPIQLG